MKVLLVLAAFVAAACAINIPDSEIRNQFENFKLTHGKKYANEAEELFRSKIFKENAIRVAKHNERFAKGEVTFKVGINQFSDMHTHEVVEARNGLKPSLKKPSPKVHRAPDGPWIWDKRVDWRSKGLVTDVKDQGECGSCWAFSATGALEGQWAKKYGKLVSLSAQNLVDCSSWDETYFNYGCDGGNINPAFQYIADNKGIDSEESYPYTAYNGECAFKAANVAANDTGYVDVHPTEKDLQHAVQTVGPVSIGIDASLWSFHSYAGGVYYDPACSKTDLDHAVLAVGFGSNMWWGSNDYWLIKNSWGSDWGENGYIRVARNKDNHCGVGTQASYPTV